MHNTLKGSELFDLASVQKSKARKKGTILNENKLVCKMPFTQGWGFGGVWIVVLQLQYRGIFKKSFGDNASKRKRRKKVGRKQAYEDTCRHLKVYVESVMTSQRRHYGEISIVLNLLCWDSAPLAPLVPGPCFWPKYLHLGLNPRLIVQCKYLL